MTPVVISFLLFLLGFVAIGAWSARWSQSTTDDYLVASRSIGPWFTALSAVATNNSGFMFIGLVGTTYTMGVGGMWIIIGWMVGDYLMWFWIHGPLRVKSEEFGAATIPSFLAARLGAGQRTVEVLTGLVVVLFLGTYASAQLNAGGKALHVLFGWQYEAGAIVGAAIVLIYCFAGGIRASIWTDVAQSVVMFASIALLCGVALAELGGFGPLFAQLRAIDPKLVDPFPGGFQFGFTPWMLGWFGAGFGVVGQPHIMIRAMSCRGAKELALARHIYFGWYVLFSAACILVALCCRVLLPELGASDAELAMPTLAQQHLPAVLVGLVMAGLFAATMSTADSQVLSCSAALTQDIFSGFKDSYVKAKIGTVVVTVLILAIALAAQESVFGLVTMAWSTLGAGLGPLMIIRALGKPISGPLATAVVLGGLATVWVWTQMLHLSDAVFEVLPGMAVGLLIYWIGSAFGGSRK